jgi:CheY-like chemotaxis protein
MLKTRRKALKSLLSEKVVNIGDYRSLRSGRGMRKIAMVTNDQQIVKGLQEELGDHVELAVFDSRFSFEQALKQNEWDIALLDERVLRDDTLTLCEKIKRQNKLDDLFVIILSPNASKDLVRQGFEKGCDEWVSKFDDARHLARLLSQHIN